jgi:hypothetical protein
LQSLKTAELIIGTLSIAGQEGRRLKLEGAVQREEERQRRMRRRSAQAELPGARDE